MAVKRHETVLSIFLLFCVRIVLHRIICRQFGGVVWVTFRIDVFFLYILSEINYVKRKNKSISWRKAMKTEEREKPLAMQKSFLNILCWKRVQTMSSSVWANRRFIENKNEFARKSNKFLSFLKYYESDNNNNKSSTRRKQQQQMPKQIE